MYQEEDPRADLRYGTTTRLLVDAAARLGAAEAIVDGDLRLSYADLDAAVSSAAAAIIGAGLVKGDRVAIWAPNSALWIVAALGLQRAGLDTQAQSELAEAIKANPTAELPLLHHAPLFATEPVQTASQHRSYLATDGAIAMPGDACQHDYYLKNTPVPKTIHSFLLMAEGAGNTVVAVYYADQAPHNWQTVLTLKLSDEEMKVYRAARKDGKTPPVLQTRVGDTNYFFCMSDLRKQIASGAFKASGTIYRDSDLSDYRLGTPVGRIDLDASKVTVSVNRNLASLMNPLAVAKDVLGH